MKGLMEKKKLFAISCILLLALTAIQSVAAANSDQKTIADANRCPGKQRWPEVVGMRGRRAAAIIERQNRFVTAKLVPPTIPTRDFRCDRVFVYLNKLNGVVTRVPGVG